MIRCKFKCQTKTETMDGITIKMIPVTHGSPENDEFFKYTPWGVLEIGTINKESSEQIHVGQDYYIDISNLQTDIGAVSDSTAKIELVALRKQLEDEKQKNRVLQLIRDKYEIKYGVRIFANGEEQALRN